MNPIVAGNTAPQLHYSATCALRGILGDEYDAAEDVVLASADALQTPESPLYGASAASPVAVSRDNFSVLNSSHKSTQAYALQSKLNKARESFCTSAEDYAARERRIASVFHDFATMVAAVVKQHVLQLVCSGWLVTKEDPFGWCQLHGIQPSETATTSTSASMSSARCTPTVSQRQTKMSAVLERLHTVVGDRVKNGFVVDGVKYTTVGCGATIAAHRSQIRAELLDNRRRRSGADSSSDLSETDEMVVLTLAFERVRKAVHREVKSRRDMLSLHHMEAYCQLPLCAAVDYMGFTVFAEVCAGLGMPTLQGGLFQSEQQWFERTLAAGEAVHNSRIAEHIHRALSVCCFLKSHPKCGVTSYGPVDLQVHCSDDGVIYARCCRRVMPPVLTLFGATRPPSSIGGSSAMCQTSGRRLLPSFFEQFCDPAQTYSPDVWLDDHSRAIDATDLECLAANQNLFDRAIPFLCDVLTLIDLNKTHGAPIASGDGSVKGLSGAGQGVDAARVAVQWCDRLDVRSVKQLFHQCGVNMCFLGRVYERLLLLLSCADEVTSSRCTPRTTCTQILSQLSSSRLTTPPESASSAAFREAHPALHVVWSEMCARAIRGAVFAELRRTSLSLSSSAAARMQQSLAKGHRRSRSKLEDTVPAALRVSEDDDHVDAASLVVERALSDAMCDMLCRVSGELLSSHSSDDRLLWEKNILPLVSASFGADIVFSRASESSSTLTCSAEDGGIGLSTAARVRTRATRHDDSDSVHRELRQRPMRLAGVDFSAWGHLADAQFGHCAPREAFVTSLADKQRRHGDVAPTTAPRTTQLDGDEVVSLVPPEMISAARRRYTALDNVRLGSSQDYRVAQRVCEMMSCWVERRADSPSGVSTHMDPHVTSLVYCSLLTPQQVRAAHCGLQRDVEQALLDDLKERKLRQAPTVSEATHLRHYYRLATLYMISGKAAQAVEWFRKMRDVLIRDIGSNEVAQGMMMLCESKAELHRKRFSEAVDIAGHVASAMQLAARETRLYVHALLHYLDAMDATNSPSATLRAKKAEVTKLLVPCCRKFGVAIGRLAARDVLGRIHLCSTPLVLAEENPPPSRGRAGTSSPASKRRSSRPGIDGASVELSASITSSEYAASTATADSESLKMLASSCVVVLREQGLDAEAANFILQLLLLTRDALYIPLAAALLCHIIPIGSSLFKSCAELLSQALMEQMQAAKRNPGDGRLAFPALHHMLVTPPSKVREPHVIMALYRQQLDARQNPLCGSSTGSLKSKKSVLVRGASSMLGSTKRAVSELQAVFAAAQGCAAIVEESSEDGIEMMGHYYLAKDRDIRLSSSERDALCVHCLLYFAKQWLAGVLRSVPEGVRGCPVRWDAAAATAYGDIVNVVHTLAANRVDVCIPLCRLLASTADDLSLPFDSLPSAGQMLELLVRDGSSAGVQQLIMDRNGYKIGSSAAPVSVASYPFLAMLHSACHTAVLDEIAAQRLAEPRARGPQVVEDDPHKEPQLQWTKEMFLAAEICVELVACVRRLHRYASAPDDVQFLYARPSTLLLVPQKPWTREQFAPSFSFMTSTSPDNLADSLVQARGIMGRTSMPPALVDVLLALFNPSALTTSLLGNIVSELVETYTAIHNGPRCFPRILDAITDRYPLQHHDVWNLYFRLATVLHEAEIDVSAPAEDRRSTFRTPEQLRDMQAHLSRILEQSKLRIGAVPNQTEWENELAMYAQRLAANVHKPPHSSTAALAKVKDSARDGATDAMTAAAATSKTVSQSAAAGDRTLGSVNASRISTTSSALSHSGLAADDTPYFSIEPLEAFQGDPLRIQWRLPTKVPPRFACVAVFAADAEVLTTRNAADVHKGLRFRAAHGDEEIRLPTNRSGPLRVAFFVTAHSDGLPLPGFIATCKVLTRPDHLHVLPPLRHELEREQAERAFVRTVVTMTESAPFIPCDSKRAHREREEAYVLRALRDPRAVKSVTHERSVSAPLVEDPSRSVVCEAHGSTRKRDVVVVVRDAVASSAAKRVSQRRYNSSINTTKSLLESAGTLVVIVSKGI